MRGPGFRKYCEGGLKGAERPRLTEEMREPLQPGYNSAIEGDQTEIRERSRDRVRIQYLAVLPVVADVSDVCDEDIAQLQWRRRCGFSLGG